MRSVSIILATCGLAAAAHAQEYFRVSYSAITVFAGTTTPSNGNINDLRADEGIRFRIGIEALLNGTSAIGQTTTFTPPPQPGSGTIRALGSFVYSFVGMNDATGAWYGGRSPHRSVQEP